MFITRLATIPLITILYLISFASYADVIKFLPNIELPSAGYLTIHNKSNKDFEIHSVTSEDFERVELHKSTIKNGMSSMQKLEKLIIPANDEIKLEPNGIHLMLFKPKNKLEHNRKIQLYFFDENNQEVFTALLTLKNRTKIN